MADGSMHFDCKHKYKVMCVDHKDFKILHSYIHVYFAVIDTGRGHYSRSEVITFAQCVCVFH